MLPAAHRMRRRQDFSVAVRRGRRAGDATLVLHVFTPVDRGGTVTLDGGPQPARVGFVVPKSVGNAVVRKRVTRRLRHLVRDRLDRLPEGSLLVVRALPPSADCSWVELSESLDAAWARASRPRPPRSLAGKPAASPAAVEPLSR